MVRAAIASSPSSTVSHRRRPRMALAAGKDGLDVIRRLLPEAEVLLTKGGRLFLEIGKGMEAQLKQLLSKTKLTWEKTVPDLQGIPRIVVAKK